MIVRTSLVFALWLAAVGSAGAQSGKAPTEAEFLVPPQGGAYEVPLHAGDVCILSFPEKMTPRALVSSVSYEIKSWGDDGVAVRALTANAEPATVALATASGTIKVNVTLTTVAQERPSLTLVRFKAVSAEEAFEAQVAAAVAARTAPLQAEIRRLTGELEAQSRDRADAAIAERVIRRYESIRVAAHERNDDHVIVHVRGAHLLGDDGYLVFEIENRSRSTYQVASVRLFDGARNVATLARVAGSVGREARLIGAVPAGTTVRAVVVIRGIDGALGRPLVLEIAGPERRGVIRVERGINLR